MKRFSVVSVAACVVVVAFAGALLTGCGQSQEASTEGTAETQEDAVTYDSIYEDYAAQLKEAGLKAVSEFESEAGDIDDATKLADLANEKVQDLAKIQIAGGEEMASLMTKNGDGYSVYEENFKKLYSVYNEQGMDVYQSYMDKYADLVPGMTDAMKQQMLDQLEEAMEQMAPQAEQK